MSELPHGLLGKAYYQMLIVITVVGVMIALAIWLL